MQHLRETGGNDNKQGGRSLCATQNVIFESEDDANDDTSRQYQLRMWGHSSESKHYAGHAISLSSMNNASSIEQELRRLFSIAYLSTGAALPKVLAPPQNETAEKEKRDALADIQDFYEHYNPLKLHSMRRTLEKYENRLPWLLRVHVIKTK